MSTTKAAFLFADLVGFTALSEFADPEQVKREGWQEQGVLAVSADDDRLTWPERELVRQLGEKLYGPRPADREARHG